MSIVLKSTADPSSEAFKVNQAAHASLAEDLRAQLARVRAGGGEKASAKHTGRGKLLPRERVERLLDRGSPFLELSALAAHGMYDDEAPGAAESIVQRDGADERPHRQPEDAYEHDGA